MKYNFKYSVAAILFSGIVTAQSFDRNAMPKPGPTPAINISQPKTFTLKNGLTVMVVENNKLPRVNVSLTIDRPPVYEGRIAGVNDLMAEQLGKGTTKISKDEFNRKVDFLGANISFSSAGAAANMLSKYFPEVFGLMADAIVNPKFTAQEIQNSKNRVLESLKAEEKNTSAIAERVSKALTYGKNTSRGEFETPESISAISLPDVQNAYSKYYAPDHAYLVVVGDVKFAEVKKLAQSSFGQWKKSGYAYTAPEVAMNPEKTEINVVDVPNAVQSVVSVGNLTQLRMNQPQYFPSLIANYILGGGAESRLFMNLREKNGFTYGAYSNLVAAKYRQTFDAQASVRNEVTDKAVKEFVNELNAISTVTPTELANAKEKLKGSFILSLEKPETIARFAVNSQTQSLPADFYTNYLKSIDKVTVADVTNAVRTSILPNQSRIFVAGKGADISAGLEKLGYPVKYYDRYANPVGKPLTQQVAAEITPGTIADKYFAAIGGKAAAGKIESITMEAAGKVQGMSVDLKMIRAKGGKTYQNISMNGNSAQKSVFDGSTGYAEAMGQKIPMNDEMKAEVLKETELFPELSFAKSGYTVAGMEKINGEDVYLVKGNNATYYYNTKTGLKSGESRIMKMGGREMTVSTQLSDYKNVSGVMMPYTLKQDIAGQNIEFAVKSYQINQATDADFK